MKMTDQELDEYAEDMLLEQLKVVEKEIKELQASIKKEDNKNLIVCIGNAAFFNFN
jgi:hypothetical protein